MGLDPADHAYRKWLRTRRPAALARVFDLVAPELLVLAQHLISDLAAAEDAVQETFLTAIEDADSFDPERRVRPWLTGILVNRIRAERRRRKRRAAPVAPPEETVPPTDREAERRELVQLVRAALHRMPETYRQVLWLDLVCGFGDREIARALDLPYETVRTRKRRGVSRLRQALPRSIGPAVIVAATSGAGFAAVRGAVVARARAWARAHALTTGRAALPTKSLVAGAVVVALCVVGFGPLRAWLGESDAGARTDVTVRAEPPAGEVRAVPGPTDRTNGSATDRTLITPARVAASTVTVAVSWADGTAAMGVAVGARPGADASWLRETWDLTDNAGEAHFARCCPGELDIRVARGGRAKAGADDTRVTLTIPSGVSVEGTVTGLDGAPAGGASLWIADPSESLDSGIALLHTDDAGRFTLRDVAPGRLLSAVIAGAVPPPPVAVGSEPHTTLRLRAEHRAATVRGRVLDATGAPLAEAAILVGHVLSHHVPVVPLRLRTDAGGRFETTSVPPELRTPVWCGAVGHAPTFDAVRLATGAVRDLTFRLAPGATVTGVVCGPSRTPISGALVEASALELHAGPPGAYPGPAWSRVRSTTDAAGRFALEGAPPVRVRLLAQHGTDQAVEARVLVPGETAEWHPVLLPDATVRGTVVDAVGGPLAGWPVTLQAPTGITLEGTTDAAGEFALQTTVSALHTVEVFDPESALRQSSVAVAQVRPNAAARIVVADDARSSAHVAAVLQDHTGAALRGSAALLRYGGDSCELAYRTRLPTNAELSVGPLPAGRYEIIAIGERLGTAVVAEFELEPREHLDLGALQLAAPGSVEFVARSAPDSAAPPPVVRFRAPAAVWHVNVRLEDGAGLRTGVQPGRYSICVWSPEHAWTYREFVVEPAARTRVELPLENGLRRRVIYDPIEGRDVWLEFTWRGAGGVVEAQESLAWPPYRSTTPGAPVEHMAAFRPGEYSVAVRRRGGPAVTTEFAVRPGGPGTIRIRMPPENPPR